MKINFLVYILTDGCGNKYRTVVKESCDNIYVGGYDDDGLYHCFDDEARHCYTWAETYGFKLECVEKEIDI